MVGMSQRQAPQERARIRQGWAQIVPNGPITRCAWVASQSKLGVEYRVAILPDRLLCECPAGSYGRYCWHREVVIALLDAEVAAIRREELAHQSGWAITPKGQAALQAWRDRQQEHPPMVRAGDTAPRRSPAAFSILK